MQHIPGDLGCQEDPVDKSKYSRERNLSASAYVLHANRYQIDLSAIYMLVIIVASWNKHPMLMLAKDQNTHMTLVIVYI